jgi:8-oxo-dGTP diphosphatase
MKMREPILAAGGIVLRGEGKPEIAVVQLRKMSTWVLPKGKLAGGESAIAAARREVIEETGHRVTVHEFLGTLAYETGGRQKIVHFWRMQALGRPTGELMRDVKAMEWLALDQAIERLAHVREQAFLEQVGPLAIRLAARPPRKSAVRRPRSAPLPQPEAIAVPELIAPADLAAPLPPERLSLEPGVSPLLGSDVILRPADSQTLLEKTMIWLRKTALLPKPEQH